MARQYYEIEISGGRKVLLQQHKCSDMERIYSAGGITGEEAGPLLMHKMAKAGLQICIREVDGRKLTYSELDAEWDELFTFQDQQRLVRGWTQIHYGEDEGKLEIVPVTMA